jgi:hypothetical protein
VRCLESNAENWEGASPRVRALSQSVEVVCVRHAPLGVRVPLALFAAVWFYIHKGVLWAACGREEYSSFEVAGVAVAAVSAFTHG